MEDIAVGLPKVPLQILHLPGKVFWGSRSKIEDVALYFTAPAIEAVIGFKFRTLGLGPRLITYVPLLLYVCPLFSPVDPLDFSPSGDQDGLV